MDWFSDRAHDIAAVSSVAWTALAAWLAVAAGIAALVYAWRQYQRAREEAEKVLQPQVAMFMEPSASGWHLIELVVKNFGRTARTASDSSSPIPRPSASTRAPTRTATSTSGR